jgi:hypothetical protein
MTRTYVCECMIAKPMNIATLGYHMHLVLYFGVLIRSSFGGVGEHIYIDTYIYRYIQSLLTANKKIDSLIVKFISVICMIQL